MNKLFIINGPRAGDCHELKSPVTFVGRAEQNDIRIDDGSVSRRHLKITSREGKFYVEDLGSHNGTWVSGKKLAPRQEVRVEAGVPLGLGAIFVSVGKRYEDTEMTTQHSIPLAPEAGANQGYPLYKDRRITNRDKLELIYEMSTLLMQTLDINQICERILDSLFDSLRRIDSGVILLSDAGGLREVIARSREGREPIHMKYSRTIVNRVMREGRAVMMSDVKREDGAELSESIEMMKIKSIMCVPLISNRGSRGVIYVHSVNAPYGFRKDDLYFFTCLSTPAALAIENALLYSRAKKAEEIIRESEEKYRLLVENAKDGIFIVQNGSVRFANPGGRRMSGYSMDELSSFAFQELFHPQDKAAAQEQQRKALNGSQDSELSPLRALTQRGETLWVLVNSVRIQWEGGPATLNFVRDVTLQHRLEERAFQSQKMEMVGTLAGGIAHEFNNLLMGIQGNASLMLLDMETSHPHYRKLRNIERHVTRGGELTQQLLGFAGEGKYEISRTDLNDVVSKTSDVFGRARKGIRIQRTMEKDLWPLAVDQRQMGQMLLNLFINAWEAMPGGGDLSIETRNVVLGEEQAAAHGVRPGRYVMLRVSDTGPGIDEKIRAKIFEPFFTTKEIGKGVGLGLAAVYGIVKNHGGFINVISENGHGATFQIYLPSSETSQGEPRRMPDIEGEGNRPPCG
ncbi:MAG: ATP-binding protein [Thermodesulfobacteriota bacterium]